MTPPAVRPDSGGRRTHAERSTETTEALLDATIDTIAAVGYRGATAAAICARAGVSQGALFHHFPTLLDLVLTALTRMTERRIASVVGRVRIDEPLDLLRLLGRLARDPVASVWAELTIAARTDAELRRWVQPAIDARWALIREAATGFPALAEMDERQRDVWLQLMRGTYELAPLYCALEARRASSRASDEGRNRALLTLAEHLGADFGRS